MNLRRLPGLATALFAAVTLTAQSAPVETAMPPKDDATRKTAPARATSVVLQAMQDELHHSLAALERQATPPYFMSYEITETNTVAAAAAFGALLWSGEHRDRSLDIDLRVGNYALDNTHAIRGARGEPPDFRVVSIPVDDDPAAIRSALWLETDRRYKKAVEQFTKVKTNVGVKVAAEDRSSDFSQETAERYSEAVANARADRRAWEAKVRRYSAPFAAHGNIYEARADLRVNVATRWLVSSEGAIIQTSEPRYQLSISAFTKADDGMQLPRYASFSALTPEGLPDDTSVLAEVDRMIKDLLALRQAPITEPYQGPAIFSGRAAGVFFHEVFGHRVEGHRLKDVDDAQTFKKKLNQPVLPETFSVTFDPTTCRAAQTDLMGCYRFDDQGVRGRRVSVVDKGVLVGFLMSRTPTEGLPSSNGHGRRQPGLSPVARQSNLIVEVDRPFTRAALKQRLIEEVVTTGRPYGLWFDDIVGGFTMTGRFIPNAFNVIPVLVFRIYPDGREELVRGVDLVGTPLTAFSHIEAADDQLGVFNGTCGAESGGVPVAAVSPGLLVSQIEVQKKEQSQERLPVLPPPFEDGR